MGLLVALASPEGDGVDLPAGPMTMAPVAVAPTGSSAPASVPAPARPFPVTTGGYVSLSPRAPQLRPVLTAAMMRLTPARHARAKIVEAEQQVVAGMNYRLLVKLRDGSRWRVVVWRRLDGDYEVTETIREG